MNSSISSPTSPRPIHIVDTTLRDGEQAPGVVFSPTQRMEIAKRIAASGVPEIESGTPAMGAAEQAALRELNLANLDVQLTAWCRATESDLDAARACGYRSVHLSLPTSTILLGTLKQDEAWVFEQLEKLIPIARAQFDFVSIGAQDASRTDLSMLIRFAGAAQRLGADRVRLADSVGCWMPLEVADCIQKIHTALPSLRLGVHMHNDLGMASANSIAALQSGATDVDVTVTGLGERAGNAPLEQIVMALDRIPTLEHGVTANQLYPLCCEVARCADRTIPPAQPIIGDDVFRHESGIHVHALLQDRNSYESFSASAVGRSQELNIQIGKHSGTASLIYHFEQKGIELDRTSADSLLQQVRARSEQLGRGLHDDELMQLAQ